MQQYHDLLNRILSEGDYKAPARSGLPGTTSLFGYQMKFDLSEGFPLMTTKKLSIKNIATELLWFLRGDTNIKYLLDNKCNIWNKDAYRYFKKILPDVAEHKTKEQFIADVIDKVIYYPAGAFYQAGDLGKIYGKQWRNWNGIDQVYNLIKGLTSNPEGRRHIINSWNVSDLEDMALSPCHALVQFNCRAILDRERFDIYNDKMNGKLSAQLGHYIYPEGYIMKHDDDIPEPIGWELSEDDKEYMDRFNIPRFRLDCQLYQRSADVFLGVPYNIASYAMLTMLIADLVGMIPGNYIHTLGDVHIYDNHVAAVKEQLSRDPYLYKLPQLVISTEFWNPEDSLYTGIENIDRKSFDHLINGMIPEDFQIINYSSYPAIKADLSVGD